MNLLIFFFSTLTFYICLYCRFISMLAHGVYIKAFSLKLTTPKLFLYFWVKSKYFFCRYAFYNFKPPRLSQIKLRVFRKPGANLYMGKMFLFGLVTRIIL